jgi:hypothetical protein
MAIALTAPLAIATAGNSSAAPVLSGALKAASPSALTDVHFYGYCTHGYYPAYKYRGYTYWYPGGCRGRSAYYYYYR